MQTAQELSAVAFRTVELEVEASRDGGCFKTTLLPVKNFPAYCDLTSSVSELSIGISAETDACHDHPSPEAKGGAGYGAEMW